MFTPSIGRAGSAAPVSAAIVGKRSIVAASSSHSEPAGIRAGQRMMHARGCTIDEVENQMLTKLVTNSADGHYNEQKMAGSPFGQRLVFGLITGSMVIGLATQDTAENALAELTLDNIRLKNPVFHGDTLYAYSQVTDKCDAERDDAGIVQFHHWGVNDKDQVVFEGDRRVLLKRRSHWVGAG